MSLKNRIMGNNKSKEVGSEFKTVTLYYVFTFTQHLPIVLFSLSTDNFFNVESHVSFFERDYYCTYILRNPAESS